jgi:penicillin-binding protein 2
MWFRRNRVDLEIAPEEIFLDASSSTFDRARFEGRLEKPLSPITYAYLGSALVLLFCILVVRGWNLQVTHGEAYAAESAHNSLEAATLFAPRGVITDVQGVVIAENNRREDGSIERRYPYPSLSHVIGYVSPPKKDSKGVYYDTSETGVTGVEAQYDEFLSGDNGQLLTERDALGNIRSQGSIVPAIEGKPLQLSLDANLQESLERAIRTTAEKFNFIAGSGVIMDTHTGAVRALVSYPSYDSNVMTSGKPAEIIQAYNKDPGRPFLDHAIQGVYAPGSIVKPIVSLGALTDGIVTERTIIDDPGAISIPDPYNPGKSYVFKGWKALGPMDVRKAIAWSSDIYFYTVGGGFKSQKGLGIDRLAYWYEQFGLGKPTGIALSGEAKGLVPTPEWKEATQEEPWYLADTYFTAIGQYSMQVTPMQMARATAAIANGGKLFTPTLIAGEVAPFIKVPFNGVHLPAVQEGMRLAVTGALAGMLNVPYVSVAAKTGTAQTGTRNQYDNSWVVGFFPYENPQYTFALVLERGPEGTGSQAVNAMRVLLDTLHEQDSRYVGGSATSSPVR